jgi:[ribosomal protein S18]-alanine N-acetyltransferase
MYESPIRVDPSPQAEPMNSADLDAVLAIENVSFPRPWSRTMFLGEIDNLRSHPTAFRIDGRIVGYLCFWMVLDEAHLLNIAVHPEYRGSGNGRAMMEYLETVCRQNGIARIILEVARGNPTARNLYKMCGFRIIGFRRNYYAPTGDDALVMEKWLAPEKSTESR